ncbi:MAG: hypothetical protein F6K31_38050 [Symploca sp. SIO2G7]|nr:hypothetical protein [Symploca sp. SIO2G7]
MKISSELENIANSAQDVSTSTRETRPASDDRKIYMAELKRYPYQPDLQVEILHLQAEADALFLQLKAMGCQ